MINYQSNLVERFQDLSDTRQGSVFFVEHGLNTHELDELREGVQANLQSHPLESVWWNENDLPLLVVASEAGYRYRGSGTDFWPLLEDDLGIELPVSKRERVRGLFVRASDRFRGVRPPDTVWAQAFHLIAWPIAHALFPVEFHRPFTMTLANLRDSVVEADDNMLYRAIRAASPYPTARFSSLLEDNHVTVTLTRCLLGQRTNELSEEIVDRISIDLQSDSMARRDLAVARGIQRASRSKIGTHPVSPTSEIKGSLRIRRGKSDLMLEAVFPVLEPDTTNRLRTSLRRRRFAPRLWGVTSSITSDQLLSGLPFVLNLTEVPDRDAALLQDIDYQGLDPQDLLILQNLRLPFELPQLFAVSSDGDIAWQVRGSEVSGHRKYWLLDIKDAGVREVPLICEIGPLQCQEIDPNSEVGAHSLAQLGYHVRFGVSVRFAGMPALTREDGIPTFLAGDNCLLVPQGLSQDAKIKVKANGNSSLLGASEMVRVVVRKGDQLVKISNDTDVREYPLRGVEEVPSISSPVRIALRSEERTIQALLAGRFNFVVDGDVPLYGLNLTVDLVVHGKRFSATGPLDPLPQVVSFSLEHPILKVLAEDEVVRELVSGAHLVILYARVGNLAVASWELDRIVRPCWWDQDLHTDPCLVSEVGPLRYGMVSAEKPLQITADRPPSDGTYLLAPLDIDLNVFGAAAQFTTLCLAPSRVKLELPTIEKPHFVRRRRGGRFGVGLEDLIEAYLRWSLAETRTVLGHLRRSQVTARLDSWVADLCCGAEWSQVEEKLDYRDAWTIFEKACREFKLGHDSYIDLTQDMYANVTHLAVKELQRSMTGLWSRLGPLSNLGTDDYDLLNTAFASAYAELAKRCRTVGKEELALVLDDADPGDAPELWDRALRQVQQGIEMRGLAAMLLPTNCAQRFIGLNISELSLNEVADELSNWCVISKGALAGAPPTWETLRSIYALWVEPEVALTMDWRGALDTLLVERTIARATRYLAIKARNASRGAA